MKNKGNGIKITLGVISLVFGILALIIGISPLHIFALIPGIIALILAGVAWFISRKNDLKKGLPVTALVIPLVAMLVGVVFQLTVKNRIAKDSEFIQQIESSSSDIQNDLNDSLSDSTEMDSNIYNEVADSIDVE